MVYPAAGAMACDRSPDAETHSVCSGLPCPELGWPHFFFSSVSFVSHTSTPKIPTVHTPPAQLQDLTHKDPDKLHSRHYPPYLGLTQQALNQECNVISGPKLKLYTRQQQVRPGITTNGRSGKFFRV